MRPLWSIMIKYDEMEQYAQNKTSKENNMIGELQSNPKRSIMAPNTGGLWDVIPRLDHYRSSRRTKRPSLSILHGDINTTKDIEISDCRPENMNVADNHNGIKLGWVQGVLTPCLLNIWGVMLFLRLSWVTGQAGILMSIIIIGISAIICVVTTLSLSAISTNGQVKGGGIYFMISRSLGPEFGASVGVVFAFANTVAAAMNTIGFCNSLNDLLKTLDVKIIDNDVNDVRIVGIIALIVMILICVVGMEWESKAQNLLITVILLAMLNFLIGTIMGPRSEEQIAQGFKGFSAKVFMDNLWPDYRYSEKSNQTFFSVFAIFFPSVTGIQAGANISGDLKDPASSIPMGTLLSLLISMFSYVIFVFFTGAAAVRDADGVLNSTVLQCIPGINCTYGLHNSYSVMQLMSIWGPLIYAGCFAATLSTALTNLLSVPRLIQALGQDRIYPALIYFSKGYGKSGEAYRGYVLTFIVAASFLLIADLNTVAPMITNCYLASYALINFCTFHAGLIRPLGWRPSFKYYNTWLSLLGFCLCAALMFLIDWMTALITVIVIFILYLVVVYRKPDVNWGSSTQAQIYKTALSTVYRLNSVDEHVKNYSPQILALTGPPNARPALIHLANLITKKNSLLISAEVFPTRMMTYNERSIRRKEGYTWLHQQRIKAFYHIVDNMNLEQGITALMQITGVGKLAPNVILMGYKANWLTCDHKDLEEYFNVLHNAFYHKMAVAILRINENLDHSDILTAKEMNNEKDEDMEEPIQNNDPMKNSTSTQTSSMQSVSIIGTSIKDTDVDITHVMKDISIDKNTKKNLKQKKKYVIEKLLNNDITSIPENKTVFQKKHKGGIIDVWWLYDDGGLTILLPYIINMRSKWEHCKMRIFALTNQNQNIDQQEKEMAEIMNKARIKYDSLKMVDDDSNAPKQETQLFFNKLISDFNRNGASDSRYQITDAQLQTLHDKTCQQLRLRELLLQNSSQSSLVVMTLPLPRKSIISAPLYMAWLEVLTRDMPPTILIRGNHTAVLTFYS